jgi:hypothetical protein
MWIDREYPLSGDLMDIKHVKVYSWVDQYNLNRVLMILMLFMYLRQFGHDMKILTLNTCIYSS